MTWDWYETFFGTGPKVAYQFYDNHRFQNKSLVWQEIGSFGLYPPIPIGEIAARTPQGFISYVNTAFLNQNGFSAGFNASLTDTATSQYLYGLSYQGTATISDVRIMSSVPEPQTLLLALLGLIGIGTVRRTPI